MIYLYIGLAHFLLITIFVLVSVAYLIVYLVSDFIFDEERAKGTILGMIYDKSDFVVKEEGDHWELLGIAVLLIPFWPLAYIIGALFLARAIVRRLK